MNACPGKEVMSCQILGEGLFEQWKLIPIVTPTYSYLMLLPRLTTLQHTLQQAALLFKKKKKKILNFCLRSFIYKSLNKLSISMSLFSQHELCSGFSPSSSFHFFFKRIELLETAFKKHIRTERWVPLAFPSGAEEIQPVPGLGP